MVLALVRTTVAMVVSADVAENGRVVSAVGVASRGVTVTFVTKPTMPVTFVLPRRMVATGLPVTIVRVARMVPAADAVIVFVPVPTPVRRPPIEISDAVVEKFVKITR